MALVPCIAISTGYILLVMFLCEMARKVVAPLNDGLVKTALNEAIAAADLCGVCFELIISKSHPARHGLKFGKITRKINFKRKT